jgi:membrane protease YdiL (CAAX protease family)
VPGARWNALRTALTFWVVLLACCGGTGVVARIMDSSWPGYDLGGTIAMALVTVAFTWLVRDQLGSLLAPRRLDRPALVAVLLTWIGLVAFIEGYVWVLGHAGMEVLGYLDTFRDAGWPLWSAFVLGAVCPAVFEELAFRGILLRKLSEVGSEREALVIQAAMFSLLHLLPMIFVSHFFIGLALGWLRLRTRSLLPGMLVHGLYNATLLALELV